VRRFFNERPDIGIIVSAVFAVALFAFVVVLDARLIVRAYQRSEAAAVVVGVGAALGTGLGVVWYLRRVNHLGATSRRVLGWVGIAWAGLFVVGFWWTHPMHRNDDPGTPLAVAVLGYGLVIVVAALGFLPVAVLRLLRVFLAIKRPSCQPSPSVPGDAQLSRSSGRSRSLDVTRARMWAECRRRMLPQ
jgi:hypothetical protein